MDAARSVAVTAIVRTPWWWTVAVLCLTLAAEISGDATSDVHFAPGESTVREKVAEWSRMVEEWAAKNPAPTVGERLKRKKEKQDARKLTKKKDPFSTSSSSTTSTSSSSEAPESPNRVSERDRAFRSASIDGTLTDHAASPALSWIGQATTGKCEEPLPIFTRHSRPVMLATKALRDQSTVAFIKLPEGILIAPKSSWYPVHTKRVGTVFDEVVRAAGGPGGLEGLVAIDTADRCGAVFINKRSTVVLPFPHLRNCRSSDQLYGVVWPSLRMTEGFSYDTWQQMLRVQQPPWEDRRSQVVWRRAPKGLKHTGDVSSRAVLVAKVLGNPLFDVGFSKLDGIMKETEEVCLNPLNPMQRASGGDHDRCVKTLGSFSLASQLNMTEQASYKMIMVMPGNGAASMMAWIFMSGSTALIPHPSQEQVWPGAMAKPWVHFVPVHYNISNVEQQAQWCMDNSARCAGIAKAARDLMLSTYYKPTKQQFTEHMQTIERAVIARIIAHTERTPSCEMSTIMQRVSEFWYSYNHTQLERCCARSSSRSRKVVCSPTKQNAQFMDNGGCKGSVVTLMKTEQEKGNGKLRHIRDKIKKLSELTAANSDKAETKQQRAKRLKQLKRQKKRVADKLEKKLATSITHDEQPFYLRNVDVGKA